MQEAKFTFNESSRQWGARQEAPPEDRPPTRPSPHLWGQGALLGGTDPVCCWAGGRSGLVSVAAPWTAGPAMGQPCVPEHGLQHGRQTKPRGHQADPVATGNPGPVAVWGRAGFRTPGLSPHGRGCRAGPGCCCCCWLMCHHAGQQHLLLSSSAAGEGLGRVHAAGRPFAVLLWTGTPPGSSVLRHGWARSPASADLPDADTEPLCPAPGSRGFPGRGRGSLTLPAAHLAHPSPDSASHARGAAEPASTASLGTQH